MEDMSLFDRFHAAFEEAPPRGAFERLQSDLTKHSAARRARPAFHMRWSRMSLRLTAAVAVVVIAIALVAAYIAAQRPTVGGMPAGSSLADYQTMISRDAGLLNNSGGDNCNSIDNSKCPDELRSVISVVRHWQADLSSVRTPQQFAVIDGQLRTHLIALDTLLSRGLAAAISHNQVQFDAALGDASNYSFNWIDLVAPAIEHAASASSSNYIALTGAIGEVLSGCVGCHELTALTPTGCFGDQAALCGSYLVESGAQITEEQAALVQSLAPSSFATKASNLQSDLDAADTAIIEMYDAHTSGDQRAFNSARAAFSNALSVVQTDISAFSTT